FQNKVVLVVGGNSGIGLSAASLFAQEGATVVVTGRDEATLQRTAASLPRTSAFRCDISDPNTLDTALEAIRTVNGRIDVLFVNAGIGAFAPIREVTPAMWDQIHAVNVRGCFFAVQKALQLMGRGGAIVLTGSVGAVLGIPGNAMYASAKAGLRAVARILAAEL